ncbi:Dephospho-CoA kinase [hydrothermal vent metagenome]|uniref:Dephospho-CoA kinase n=1 Tax=hydrothermal vent metagenome TaxID=652676 RepID=A0A3B1D8Z9_9ZZZZ
MYVIGLTGSLGTGKSTVASMLKICGANVLDADAIARRQLYRNSPCFAEVVRVFGECVLTRQRIDRKKMAAIVFNDRTKLRKLEKIIHPVVRKVIMEGIERNKNVKKITVVDVPLLFESGLNKRMDYVIVVKAKRNLQIQRAEKKLGISKEQILKRIKIQMPLSTKIRRADFIIDNNGSLNQTRKKVDEIWRLINGKISAN